MFNIGDMFRSLNITLCDAQKESKKLSVRIWVFLSMCVCVCVYVCVCVCVCVSMKARMRVCMHLSINVRLYLPMHQSIHLPSFPNCLTWLRQTKVFSPISCITLFKNFTKATHFFLVLSRVITLALKAIYNTYYEMMFSHVLPPPTQ